jgi:hypothetical protein
MAGLLRALSSAAALLLIAPALADRAAEICPLLPPDSGLTWSYAEGSDFAVCYASASGSKATVFGVYLGNEPNFDPTRATRVALGHVAGKDVIWYRKDSAAEDETFARQTVIALNGRYIAHLWVNASTEVQLRQRLAILEHIAFRR